MSITELSELKKWKWEERPAFLEDANSLHNPFATEKTEEYLPYRSYIWMLEQFIYYQSRISWKSSRPSLTMMMNRTMANGNMVISLWKTSKVGIQFRITRNRK